MPRKAIPERVRLLRLAPGAAITLHGGGGIEVFVMAGGTRCNGMAMTEGFWLRYPPGEPVLLASDDGCPLYLKFGHLADA